VVESSQNDPPVANDDDFTGNPVDEGGTLTNLNVLANDTDSDGSLDAKTVTITGATNGVATVNPNGTVNFTHDGSETSTASFTYTVDDDGGATSNVATASLAVSPVNDPPVIPIATARSMRRPSPSPAPPTAWRQRTPTVP
jgi:hypothetical protein